MQNTLPETDAGADETLFNALLHYVKNKNMPIKTARKILQSNLRKKTNFNDKWVKFNDCIANETLI